MSQKNMLFLIYLFLISHPVFYLLYNENYMKTSVAYSFVILRIFFFTPPQAHSLTPQPKVCLENEPGSVTAVGRTRGGITPLRGRSNVTTPASVTAPGR